MSAIYQPPLFYVSITSPPAPIVYCCNNIHVVGTNNNNFPSSEGLQSITTKKYRNIQELIKKYTYECVCAA